MSYAYEATIVRELGRFFGRGGVYKGVKPVHWCISDQTALAEAEVEYEDRTDESIWVKFPLTPESQAMLPFLQGKQASVLIWTTTPWTLPANLAIAFHPSYEYVWAETDGEVFLLAKELAEPVLQKLGFPKYHILHTMPGEGIRRAEGSTSIYRARFGVHPGRSCHPRPRDWVCPYGSRPWPGRL